MHVATLPASSLLDQLFRVYNIICHGNIKKKIDISCGLVEKYFWFENKNLPLLSPH